MPVMPWLQGMSMYVIPCFRLPLRKAITCTWCETRVKELDSHVSYLSPVWYFGSFAIGAVAGLSGDKWNLGFVMETERQVVEHLDKHLELLPEQDRKSRTILQQMRRDEQQHASRCPGCRRS